MPENTSQDAATEKCTRMITLRVTAREHYPIKRAAESQHKSINQWCKSLLVNEAEIVFLESKAANEPAIH